MFKEVVKKYYLKEIINLNNSNALWREELLQRISSLRELIKKHFKWDGEIALLPNLYYANKLLEHNKVKAIHLNSIQEVAKEASFFTFVPRAGVAILGYKGDLEPLYIGANSISSLGRESYTIRKDYRSFECGTQNYPLLFILEKYFSSLNE
ncbi:hypothetical protein A6V39_04765 [Candidatus Mycoplasma haematobovis]|uniref:Uncharacterized protein n=1 Tax=Candidatus Mycoplasma haematobovis TaxID=432608 RepID=A0A1A9QBA2_9MOLU|nr:hypothetical protein [Candidatus Mycoplasma haematobovis]OAL09862.1 hypothetical protein A6V39_04765 [Candidatus Mycoplasma haematobovis]